MVDESLVKQLEPLKDQNRMISDGSGVLAWATPKRDLVIIGSATFNFQDKAFNKNVQTAPMATLPPNAQVPDGIAVAISTIEALNAYMPVKPVGGPVDLSKQSLKQAASQKVTWNINFNTSNRTQIAAYLADKTDVDAFTANLQVAMIVYLRSKNNFGLNDDQVSLILKTVEQTVKGLRSSNPDLEASRVKIDKTFGVDWSLDGYVKVMTENQAWKSLWTGARIQC